MELNFRKLWTVLGVACLSANLAAAPASSSGSSSSSTQMSNTDQSMMASGLMYAGPQLGEDATGISLGADYILWQVVQEGLEFTAGNVYPTGTNAALQGGTNFPKFRLLNGFKVHGQVTIAECDDVDLFLQYIWLQRSSGTNSGTGATTVYPLMIIDFDDSISSSDSVSSWASSFKTSYNVIDLEMGRLTSIAKDSFSLRPFWGIRGVWNSHTWVSSWVGTVSGTQSITYSLNSYQNTSGAGVRGGFDLAWQFFANSEYFGGLKIIGMTALSGVYGRTYVNTLTGQAPTAASGTNTNGQVFYSNRTSLNRMVPVVDLSIGLSWNMSFGGERDNDYNVEIHALWDTQSWIGYGRHFTAFWAPRGPQNLTVQGFTIGAELAF